MATSNSSELLTVEDLAAFLRISKTGVYRLVETRSVPFYRVGGVLRFDRDDIVAYLRGMRVDSL